MPLLGLFILFNLNTYISFAVSADMRTAVYLICLVFTLFLPVVNVLFLYWKGAVHSLQLDTRQERIVPLMLTTISFGMGFYFLTDLPLPGAVVKIILGAMIVATGCLLITFFWKISIHMAGIGGLVGAMIGLSDRLMLDLTVPLIFLVLCSGLIGFSRLHLQTHTPPQVYLGFLLGLVCEIGSFYW